MRTSSLTIKTSGGAHCTRPDEAVIRPAIHESENRCAPVLFEQEHFCRLIVGEGCSPGMAEGKAAVVRRPEDLLAVEDGAILISATLSPALAAVFARTGGLVCLAGGALSAAATVARECGIPVVVAAAENVNTGDLVRVDGDNGVVVVSAAGSGSPQGDLVDPNDVGSRRAAVALKTGEHEK